MPQNRGEYFPGNEGPCGFESFEITGRKSERVIPGNLGIPIESGLNLEESVQKRVFPEVAILVESDEVSIGFSLRRPVLENGS